MVLFLHADHHFDNMARTSPREITAEMENGKEMAEDQSPNPAQQAAIHPASTNATEHEDESAHQSSRESLKGSRHSDDNQVKAKRSRPDRTPSPSLKKREKKEVHTKKAKMRVRQRSPSPSASDSLSTDDSLSSSESEAETDSDTEKRLEQHQRAIDQLLQENDRLRVKLSSKKKKRRRSPSSDNPPTPGKKPRRPRSPSPPLPPCPSPIPRSILTDEDEVADCSSQVQQREPYVPKSEGEEFKWMLKEDQQKYLQRFINVHFSDGALKEITKEKPPPSNITFAKKNDSYITTKFNLATNKGESSKDQTFTKIANRIGLVMGPLGKTWEMLVAISKGEADANVNIDEILLNIEQAIVMLGQSVNYATHQRRLAALKCYGYNTKEDVRKLLEPHIERVENEPEFLFGETFAKQLSDSSKSDKKTDEALTKHRENRKKLPQTSDKSPFRGGPRGNQNGGASASRGQAQQKVSFFSGKQRSGTGWNQSRNKPHHQRGKNLTKFGSFILSQSDTNKIRPGSSITEKLVSHKNRRIPTSCKNKVLHKKLGTGHKGPKHSKTYERMDNSPFEKTLSDKRAKTTLLLSRGKNLDRHRGQRDAKKGCYYASSSTKKSIHKQSFSDNKKGRKVSASRKFKKSQCLHPLCKIQDGGDSGGQGPLAAKRSDGKTGSEGRVFFGPSKSRISKVSPISLERKIIPVSLHVLRDIPGTSNFYKGNENSHIGVKKAKHTSRHLFGRFNHIRSKSAKNRNGKRHDNISLPTSRSDHKLKKIRSSTKQNHGILGGGNKFHPHDPTTSNLKSCFHRQKMPVPFNSKENNNTKVIEHNRYPDLKCSGSSASPITIQIPSTTTNRVPNGSSGLRPSHNPEPPQQIRAEMVDNQSHPLQRQTITIEAPRPSDNLRCSNFGGLGGDLPGGASNGGSMGQIGDELAHKRARIACSRNCTEMLSEGQTKPFSTSLNRQHNCTELSSKNGGNNEQNHDKNFKVDMVISPLKRDFTHSRVDSIGNELGCRLRVQKFKGLKRVETLQDHISKDLSNLGNSRSRRICVTPFTPSSSILQLEDGSLLGRNRCPPAKLEGQVHLRVSSFLLDRKNSEKTSALTIRDDFGDASLDNEELVCHSSGNVSPESHFDKTEKGAPKKSTGEVPSPLQSKSSGLEIIRKNLSTKGISGKAAKLISQSRREGTISNYETSWKKFNSWCFDKKVDPIQGDLASVLDFLSDLFEKGLAYRTINNYRSAISAFHSPIDGIPVGQHKIVCQLMLGVANKRPPQPRYTFTWDVQQVLDYLMTLPCNDELSLKDLTIKTTGLLALSQINRGSELKYLNLNFMTENRQSYIFSFNRQIKNSRGAKRPPEMVFHSFPGEQNIDPNDRKLCPYTTLKHYMKVTEDLRGEPRKSQLLIGQIKPHKEVVKCTIAGWLKLLLSKSGINTTIFKAHSYRSASSSKAKVTGVPIEAILKTGNWSNSSVWQKFYDKPIRTSSMGYQGKILASRKL